MVRQTPIICRGEGEDSLGQMHNSQHWIVKYLAPPPIYNLLSTDVLNRRNIVIHIAFMTHKNVVVFHIPKYSYLIIFVIVEVYFAINKTKYCFPY